jgi:hypothetical protein
LMRKIKHLHGTATLSAPHGGATGGTECVIGVRYFVMLN